MKIRDWYKTHTSDFWYDLTDGGYLKPEEMLENPEDAARVMAAIATIQEFEAACNEQIDEFYI